MSYVFITIYRKDPALLSLAQQMEPESFQTCAAKSNEVFSVLNVSNEIFVKRRKSMLQIMFSVEIEMCRLSCQPCNFVCI